LAWLLLVAASPVVRAQEAVQAGLERGGPIDQQKRNELYEALRQHAAVLEAQAAVVKTVAKLVGPTVVHIEADVVPLSRAYPHSQHKVEEAGSGVIIEWKGKHYILTNRHVIRDASSNGIKINLADGRLVKPLKIWTDADTDVAVMQVVADNLVAAKIGDSDRMEIGDFVLAVGSPFGLSHSVTYGIVSAKGRRDLRLGDASLRFQDFLQTDAAINPGNSGGPLVNLRGEVIGINTAIASNSGGNEGIGFAIPVNMFMIVGRQLIEFGKVTRAFLGVNLDSTFGPAMAAEVGLPCPMGARVSSISRNSPAAAAGLEVGDVILEFNHLRVEDDAHLVNVVSLTGVGQKVPVLVWRNRATHALEVLVGDRDAFRK
jgi:serine protease Do